MSFTPSFLQLINTPSLSDAADIDNYFIKSGGAGFTGWFNTRVAGRQNWSALRVAGDSGIQNRFNGLWSNESIQTIFGAGNISLLQFLALQSIIINETGGNLVPVTESVGSHGHPGIAYAFDHIPGLKRSYNTMPGNKTCFALFSDPLYNKAFDSLPLADKLKGTQDEAWAGEAYPQQSISTSTDPAVTGYVLEADFYKFRGRGFIQTTGRANYSQLVQYIMGYAGDDAAITGIQAKWKSVSADADMLATVSTNADWSRLFGDGICLVAGKAIAIHNSGAGHYLQQLKSPDENTMEHSLYNMGLRINGGESYATLFQNRVLQVLELLQ